MGIISAHNTADFVYNTRSNNGVMFSTRSITYTPEGNSLSKIVSISLYHSCT